MKYCCLSDFFWTQNNSETESLLPKTSTLNIGIDMDGCGLSDSLDKNSYLIKKICQIIDKHGSYSKISLASFSGRHSPLAEQLNINMNAKYYGNKNSDTVLTAIQTILQKVYPTLEITRLPLYMLTSILCDEPLNTCYTAWQKGLLKTGSALNCGTSVITFWPTKLDKILTAIAIMRFAPSGDTILFDDQRNILSNVEKALLSNVAFQQWIPQNKTVTLYWYDGKEQPTLYGNTIIGNTDTKENYQSFLRTEMLKLLSEKEQTLFPSKTIATLTEPQEQQLLSYNI